MYIEEEQNIIKSARWFILAFLIVAGIYFNKWWFWVLVVANTISDFVYPFIVQKRNKTNEEELE